MTPAVTKSVSVAVSLPWTEHSRNVVHNFAA